MNSSRSDASNTKNIFYDSGNLEFPDSQKAVFGDGDDLQIYHSGTQSFILNNTGNLILSNMDPDSDNEIHLRARQNEQSVTCKNDGAVELYYDNSKKFETTSLGTQVTGRMNVSGNFEQDDGVKANWGNSHDLQIYHDGNNSFIENAGTGSLNLYGDEVNILNKARSEFKAKFITNGAVELYYDNVKKMETSSVGVTMNDTVITNGEIRPASDNNHSIGRSNRRYITYFGVNGSINTSDKNEKNTIIDSDLGLDFINKLKPISYKWNKDDGKTHYGLIAQDLEETLTSLGKTIADFGGIYKEDDSPMGLGYSELIAPLIKAVQELSTEVAALKAA
jgi:hypothetical protein